MPRMMVMIRSEEDGADDGSDHFSIAFLIIAIIYFMFLLLKVIIDGYVFNTRVWILKEVVFG